MEWGASWLSVYWSLHPLTGFPWPCSSFVTANTSSCSWAASWDRDRWANSHWLHVFALLWNAVPRGLDLHTTESNSPPQLPLGLLVQKPSLLFPRIWRTGLQLGFMDWVGKVMVPHPNTVSRKHPFLPYPLLQPFYPSCLAPVHQ